MDGKPRITPFIRSYEPKDKDDMIHIVSHIREFCLIDY
jgi:hypothetical protein